MITLLRICNGAMERVPGTLFVLAYREVSVFWLSGIVD